MGPASAFGSSEHAERAAWYGREEACSRGVNDTQGGEFFWGRAGAGGEKNWQAGWGVGWAGGERVRARQVGRGSVAAGVVGAKGGGPRIEKIGNGFGREYPPPYLL